MNNIGSNGTVNISGVTAVPSQGVYIGINIRLPLSLKQPKGLLSTSFLGEKAARQNKLVFNPVITPSVELYKKKEFKHGSFFLTPWRTF